VSLKRLFVGSTKSSGTQQRVSATEASRGGSTGESGSGALSSIHWGWVDAGGRDAVLESFPLEPWS